MVQNLLSRLVQAVAFPGRGVLGWAYPSHGLPSRESVRINASSSLDRYVHELSREPFIPAIRVLCKPFSKKWFLSRLM